MARRLERNNYNNDVASQTPRVASLTADQVLMFNTTKETRLPAIQIVIIMTYVNCNLMRGASNH